ncbi:MAG: peptidoglycan DD-metalloendopeptidase family protein, partial [Pseudomonadota bacterium]
ASAEPAPAKALAKVEIPTNDEAKRVSVDDTQFAGFGAAPRRKEDLLKLAVSQPAESQAPSPEKAAQIAFAPPALNPRRASEEKSAARFAPRLNPRRTIAAASIAPSKVAASRPIRFGERLLADEGDGPARVFFTSDLAPRAINRTPLPVALIGDVDAAPRDVTVTLSRGETFVDALKRAGVRTVDRNAAAFAFGKLHNLRKLRPGQRFDLTIAPPNQTLFQLASADQPRAAHLLALDFRADQTSRISLVKGAEGFDGEKRSVPVTKRLAMIEGRIDGSLYLSAKRAGAPDGVIADLANMFAYDIDFQRDIFGGDEFEAIFEVLYDDAGEIIGSGDVLFGRLKWRGRNKEKGYYLFSTAGTAAGPDYFDRAGQSAKRLLMKTPIDGARLSSGFGTRRHPILGYRKAHKGVDFAAPRGTPIYAAGDGVVERANRYGSFGNYIRIRHSSGYKTAYAHLKGFRRGVRAGKRVRQGDVIGYVGTTGRSTGPHLHYEVIKNGKHVNPQRLKISTGVKLRASQYADFETLRDRIDAMRTPPRSDRNLLAEDEGLDAEAAL